MIAVVLTRRISLLQCSMPAEISAESGAIVEHLVQTCRWTGTHIFDSLADASRQTHLSARDIRHAVDNVTKLRGCEWTVRLMVAQITNTIT
eukprot:g18478.t1